MLILKRKRGESIKIGPVTVTVCGHGRGGVTLGIEAPDEMAIRRVENAIANRVPLHELRDRLDAEEHR